jgi:hypothetical protein
MELDWPFKEGATRHDDGGVRTLSQAIMMNPLDAR